MKRFIEGECRIQTTLLPECIDDYISDTNPVRIVDELNLGNLGFEGIEPAATGRPAYHPAILLKIYIYGYLNRIQSSRRLEKEAQRNVELMWLTERLPVKERGKFASFVRKERQNLPVVFVILLLLKYLLTY